MPEQEVAAFLVPPEWLDSRVTLAELEGPNRASDLIQPADLSSWRGFKHQLRPQDELWYFTSPPESFGHGAGQMGYVLLRNGQQVARFIAMMS